MSSSDSSVRFVDDTRAVSAVIGFILIFGILVLLLTTYQAAIVPQQNAQTEFEHFEDNRNEMVQLRNAISTAGQSDVSQFPSVKLGTNYQTRLLTINPAPPAGTLQTSEESYDIIISDGTNDPVEIPTRFLEYEPGYNEISVGSTWYENSVLYLDERGTSSTVIIEEQNLITNGEKLKLTALQNQFSQSGTSRTTLELYPTRSSEKELEELEGELTVEIPTRLTDSDHWEILNETLDENTAVRSSGVDENNEIDDGVFYLELEVDNESVVELNTVGIREEPEDPAKNTAPDSGSGSGSEVGQEPTGSAKFVAGDVAEDDDSQTFAFDTDGTDNNQDGVIDLSDPQNAGGVDYTGLDVSDLEQQAPGNDELRYNQENNEIVYDVGGQPSVNRLELTVNGIDVSGNSGETYTVNYDDEESDSDDFTIRSAGTQIISGERNSEVTADGEDVVVLSDATINEEVEAEEGSNVFIQDRVTANGEIEVEGGGSLTIGDDFVANEEVDVEDGGMISVGDDGVFNGKVTTDRGSFMAGDRLVMRNGFDGDEGGSFIIGNDAEINGNVELEEGGDFVAGDRLTMTDTITIDNGGNVEIGSDGTVNGDIESNGGVVDIGENTNVGDVSGESELICGNGATVDGNPCD